MCMTMICHDIRDVHAAHTCRLTGNYSQKIVTRLFELLQLYFITRTQALLLTQIAREVNFNMPTWFIGDLSIEICVCRHGQDFRLWKERTSNIAVAAVYATMTSWLLLPWFSSDSQLLLIADAYVSSAQMLYKVHDTFCKRCKEAAEVNLQDNWFAN